MSHEIDSDTAYKKPGKSVKRVRFSDEVESVPNFSEYDDSSSSLKTESETITPLAAGYGSEGLVSSQTFSVEHEAIHDEVPDDSNINSSSDSSNSVPNEIQVNSHQTESDTFSSQVADDSVNNVHTDNSSKYSASGNAVSRGEEYNSETKELNDLINETRLMTISSTVSPDFTLQAENPHGLSSSANRIESSFGDIVKKNGVSTLSRKRSLEGILVEKQTTKLNSCLRKNSTEFNSASELKANVYNAWYKVKNESLHVPKNIDVPDLSPKNESSEKPNSDKAYDTWKRTKRKTKKVNHKISESVFPKPKSKEDIEEGKMAFRAWKKKKDEMLRQQKAEKYRKEEKERMDSLMNERIRKNDAESAFSAWNAHKSATMKLEKKRNQWFLQKEKEKFELKIKRSDEASEVYYEWLKNKVYSSNTNSYKETDDRPPWTPPGRSSSMI